MKTEQQPIDPSLAQGCLDEYKKVYLGDDISKIQKAFTDAVIFSIEKVEEYLTELREKGIKGVELCLGVYTKEFQEAYPEKVSPSKIGRLTIFLWYPDGTVMNMKSGGDEDGDNGEVGGGDPDPVNFGDLIP